MSASEILSPATPEPRTVQIDIGGMTCASCVSRVERKLGKLEGVSATVNLPLETAQVTVRGNIADQQILDTVQATGYTATLKNPAGPGAQQPARERETRARPEAGGRGETAGHQAANTHQEDHLEHGGAAASLRPRLILAAIFTVPMFLISMFPALQFPHWGWAAGLLTLPVVTWAAWPFHRAAAINARHLASTMDTLVSIGVSAALPSRPSSWPLIHS